MNLKNDFLDRQFADNFYKYIIDYFDLCNYKALCCYDSTCSFAVNKSIKNFADKFNEYMHPNSRLIINSFQAFSRSLGTIRYTSLYLLCPFNFTGGAIFKLDNEWESGDIFCPTQRVPIQHNQLIDFEGEQLTLMEHIDSCESPLIYVSISNHDDE